MDDKFIAVIVAFSAVSVSGLVLTLWKNIQKKHIIVENDQGSYLLFWIVVPTCLVIAFTAYFTGVGNLHFTLYCVSAGVLMVFAGLYVRWKSILSLGFAYTAYVAIITDHHLKTDGMFKHVRHPSYTGMLMCYTGLGITMHNWISILVLMAGPLVVALNRIKMEEKMLVQHFGGTYLEYMKRTERLIPLVY